MYDSCGEDQTWKHGSNLTSGSVYFDQLENTAFLCRVHQNKEWISEWFCVPLIWILACASRDDPEAENSQMSEKGPVSIEGHKCDARLRWVISVLFNKEKYFSFCLVSELGGSRVGSVVRDSFSRRPSGPSSGWKKGRHIFMFRYRRRSPEQGFQRVTSGLIAIINN